MNWQKRFKYLGPTRFYDFNHFRAEESTLNQFREITISFDLIRALFVFLTHCFGNHQNSVSAYLHHSMWMPLILKLTKVLNPILPLQVDLCASTYLISKVVLLKWLRNNYRNVNLAKSDRYDSKRSLIIPFLNHTDPYLYPKLWRSSLLLLIIFDVVLIIGFGSVLNSKLPISLKFDSFSIFSLSSFSRSFSCSIFNWISTDGGSSSSDESFSAAPASSPPPAGAAATATGAAAVTSNFSSVTITP